MIRASKAPEAAPPLLGQWSAQLTTRSGLRCHVRPAAPDDEPLLRDMFKQVTPQDLRFRFLSPIRSVRESLVHDLVAVDHTQTENLLAFDAADGTLIATAMIAADPSLERAEVAIAIRADMKHRGLGWTLLEHVADYAKSRGIGSLESIECRDNRDAIALEQEMGFTATACPGDATLVLVRKNLREDSK